MKKTIIFLLLVFEFSIMYSQSQVEKDLQSKYWVYKDRFNKHFVRIGSEAGMSLTADAIRLSEGSYAKFGRLNFGDVMAFHGDYLGVLTSEYWLLKNDNKPTTGILNEIYFAINAVERVDRYATYFYKKNNIDPKEPIDGHFLRDDVPEGFYEVWEEYGDSLHTQGSNTARSRVVDLDTTITVQLSTGPATFRAFFGKDWDGTITKHSTKDEFYANDAIYSPLFAIPPGSEDAGNKNYVIAERFGRDPHNHGYGSLVNEMSQDQLIGIFFGFQCVKKFVGSDVAVDPDGSGPLPSKNLHLWISEITDGIMSHLSKTTFNITGCEAETVGHGECISDSNFILFSLPGVITLQPNPVKPTFTLMFLDCLMSGFPT